MNKTLTISLVAALGIAGGGAYTLMDTENNYSEYIPEPVATMIGDYLPEHFKPQQQESESVEVIREETYVDEPVVANENYVEDVNQSIQQLEPVADEAVAEEFYEPEPEQVAVEESVIGGNSNEYTEQSQVDTTLPPVSDVVQQNEIQENAQNIIQSNTDQNEDVVEVAMKEIQETLSESLEPANSVSNDPQAISLVEKINATASEISRLSIENKALQDKFQKILRKNRERAKQLEEIDGQISQLN